MILFLDIDGVLNSTRSWVAHHHNRPGDINGIDPIAVMLVNAILKHCDTLVLSSTHRKFYAEYGYGGSLHISQLHTYLTNMGIQIPKNFDITENDISSSHRGNQINQWLAKYNTDGAYMIKPYVILDDSTDFYDYQNLVRTNYELGLTLEDYKKALEFLGIKDNGIVLL